MRVGSLDIDPGVLLAPMEAVTDLPFRTICEELGAGLTFTEFLTLTSFVGREAELNELRDLLAREERLLTLVGPPERVKPACVAGGCRDPA